MNIGAAETYTHLLVPISKSLRPTPQAVCTFLHAIIQSGTVGQDHKIGFCKVIKVDQPVRRVLDPFTRKWVRRKMPSRRSLSRGDIWEPSQIIAAAQGQPEYDAFLESMSMPKNPPLEVGLPDKTGNGVREAWSGPGYLKVCCCVRNSLVRLYDSDNLKRPNAPPSDDRIPSFDENCGEDEADGFFVHPKYPNAIRIPNGGSGRFWIELSTVNGYFREPKAVASSFSIAT